MSHIETRIEHGYDFFGSEVGRISAETTAAMTDDPEFAKRVSDHQRGLMAARQRRESEKPEDITNAGIGNKYEPSIGARVKASISSCKAFPGASAASLANAVAGVTATKERRLGSDALAANIVALCDHLGIEDQEERVEFYYSLLFWLFKNTASGEHGQDSTIGTGQYSAQDVMHFFDNDIRPFATAAADDAVKLIRSIYYNREHPHHDEVVTIGTQNMVPNTPWVAYDGYEGVTKTTKSDHAAASKIKAARLSDSTNYNLNSDAPRNDGMRVRRM